MLIPIKTNGYTRDGRRLCHLDMGNDAPDTSRQDAIAADQLALSREQWEWNKQQQAAAAPYQAAAARTASAVASTQMAAMKQQMQIAGEYHNRNKSVFWPLENTMVADAQNYDTPQRRAQVTSEAMADTQNQLSLSQAANNRSMTRMGVNPNSSKFALTNNAMSLGSASARSAAGRAAEQNVETQGWARKMDAASLGRGLASAQATAAGTALQAGSSAVNAAATPTQLSNSTINAMTGALGTTLGGMSGAASIYQNSTNQQAQANDNSAMWGALGSIGGGLLAGSDKNQKEGRKKVKPELSLAAIRKLPASESWSYKDGSNYADGRRHVGPMAQDVRKSLGDEAAPGGKVIDMVSMNGHTLNAIKALDKKVDKALSLAQARKGTK